MEHECPSGSPRAGGRCVGLGRRCPDGYQTRRIACVARARGGSVQRRPDQLLGYRASAAVLRVRGGFHPVQGSQLPVTSARLDRTAIWVRQFYGLIAALKPPLGHGPGPVGANPMLTSAARAAPCTGTRYGTAPARDSSACQTSLRSGLGKIDQVGDLEIVTRARGGGDAVRAWCSAGSRARACV